MILMQIPRCCFNLKTQQTDGGENMQLKLWLLWDVIYFVG